MWEAVSRWVQGAREPNGSNVSLAKALGVDTSTGCLGQEYDSARLLAGAVILYALRHSTQGLHEPSGPRHEATRPKSRENLCKQ